MTTLPPDLSTGELLTELGLPPGDDYALTPSPLRFPDGAHYRVEIPSVEGPRCLEAVLREAARLDVPVARVSQGTGIGLLTDTELKDMVDLAAEAGVELSLFARPGAGWDTSAMARSSSGAVVAACARGQDQLVAVVDEIRRAADLGVRSVLIADIGVLTVFARLRSGGALPADMSAKVSVMLPAANPAAARTLAEMGAGTLNLPTDLTVPQIAAIRAATTQPIDMYVEVPDDQGGFVRFYEVPEIVRLAAPVYVKLGLRNAPNIYPSGLHLEDLAVKLGRERVRRAELVLRLLEERAPDLVENRGDDRPPDLGIPEL